MTNCITFFCEIEIGLEAKKLDEESREMRGNKLCTSLFVGIYSNFRGRKTDPRETLSYHLAAVTSLAHLSCHVFIMKCRPQQGILHTENAIGMSCDVFLVFEK